MGLFGFGRKEENRDDVLPMFKDKFIAIQTAVNEGNQDVLREECTEEMFDFFMKCKADNIRNRVRNIIENVVVENIFTIDTFYDEDLNQDFHAVRLQFTMSDYYVDPAGELVEGSKEPEFMEETWVFTRKPHSSFWILASIEED
jgi:predicted lipid-binding transport protein (Tim44 family)